MTQPVSEFCNEIEDILQLFSQEELISLATTITGGLLKNKIVSRKDAVSAIITYSEDVESILRRKLFTREKLLSYLYDKKVSVRLPITKPELIKKIVDLWQVNVETYQETLEEHISEEIENNVNVRDSNNSPCDVNNVPQSPDSSCLAKKDSNQETQLMVLELAEKFSQWFYHLLNDNQLSADHFFPDASLTLTLSSDEQSNSNTILNDQAGVTSCLLTTKNQYDLYFNPNLLKENIKAKMDPHGLVMLVVSGTLHSKNICVGVFDQMFALARDPFAENNWKIKRTDLNLKSGASEGVPKRLCNSEDSNNTAIT